MTEFRERCKDYINCDICHKYAPTAWCEMCAIDWCKECSLTHDAIHDEVKEATADLIDATPAI